jgi:hypothetical protein
VLAVTYRETTMPVIEYYKRQGKVAEVSLRSSPQLPSLMHAPCQIDSSPSVGEVHTAAVAAVERVLI